MKITKKLLAGVLALTLISSTAVSVYAATEHWKDSSEGSSTEWNEWKTEWETVKDDYEKVSLNPGTDQTKLNFSWYSKTEETPAVRLSNSSDMAGAVEFTGEQTVIESSAAVGYYSNKVTVSGLLENTQYYYQVYKDGIWCDAEEYSTKGFDKYSVLYVGDPQIGACKGQTSSEGETMSNEIAARNDAFSWNQTLTNAVSAHPNISFILSAGDQVNKAEREYEYAGFLNAEALSSLPISTTIGNHDSGSYQYSYHFNNPNSFDFSDETYTLGHSNAGSDYYYTYGDVLYIVLDTNNYNCATHKSVIQKAISENEDAKWRVVMFHQDIYGSGLDHSDSDGIILRTQLTPIMDENDIDIVLQGHDHTYSRTYQLSGDGEEHTAYDNNNFGGDDYLSQNNCYVINTSESYGNKVIDPEGTIYMEANSSTGSKFYNLIDAQQDYIAERSQTWTPSYSIIDFTETTATITTYDANTNEILAGSSSYTIVKKADSSSLAQAIQNAENKLNDGTVYTEESVAAVNTAIANAQAVIDDPESTSDEISNAEADLANAVAALLIYTNHDSSSSNPDNSSSSETDTNSSQADTSSISDTSSSSSNESQQSGNNGNNNQPSDKSNNAAASSNPVTGTMKFAPIAAIASLAGLALITSEEVKKRKNGK